MSLITPAHRHDALLLGGGLAVGGAVGAGVAFKIVSSSAANAEAAAVKAARIQTGTVAGLAGIALGAGLLWGIPKLMDALHGHKLLQH